MTLLMTMNMRSKVPDVRRYDSNSNFSDDYGFWNTYYRFESDDYIMGDYEVYQFGAVLQYSILYFLTF